jgi:circadian clock protein KaiC
VRDQQRFGALSTESPRLSTGVRGLDQMMDGGIPAGCSILIAGPSGSGKTVLSSQFLAEGVACGEPGLLALFEKGPSEYLRTNPLGPQLGRILDEGLLHMVYLRPLDLSMDETLEEIRRVIIAQGVKRVVIDSLSSLELALAPAFRDDFRETLHRMVMMLTAMGVTLLLTVEVADSYIDLRFSPHGTAFLTDGILVQRYIELDGQLQRIMAVVKLRGSQHSKALIQYDITNEGVVIGTELSGYEGLMTGSPRKMKIPTPEK